jgi:hypothetical protein
MNKVLKITFAMIEIIFFAASTIIVFVAAAAISLMAMIVAMIYAPFTFFVENANIAVIGPWIVAPFKLAIENSWDNWHNLERKLSKI